MAIVNNQRLYDIAVRHQSFVEGVKAQYANEFNDFLARLQVELNRVLVRVKFKTLDGMTKAELRNFVLALRKSQSQAYNGYTPKIIKQLNDFMRADLSLTRRIYVSENDDSQDQILSDDDAIEYLSDESNKFLFIPIFGRKNIISKDGDGLWGVIRNEPIPANGLLIEEMIKDFTEGAQKSVELEIKKGYANGEALDDIKSNLFKESSQGTSSVFARIKKQADTILDTSVQHVTSIVSAGVQSAIYKEYVWKSVLDSRTSDICITRSGKVYKFGSGVLPPAHYRCRSSIVPLSGGDDVEESNIYEWARTQPKNVQRAIFGEEITKKINDKNLTDKDLPKYRGTPLTLDEFDGKINEILQR